MTLEHPERGPLLLTPVLRDKSSATSPRLLPPPFFPTSCEYPPHPTPPPTFISLSPVSPRVYCCSSPSPPPSTPPAPPLGRGFIIAPKISCIRAWHLNRASAMNWIWYWKLTLPNELCPGDCGCISVSHPEETFRNPMASSSANPNVSNSSVNLSLSDFISRLSSGFC